jgi:serine protease Do
VMAMGSPWALARSVTVGIVSNTERILGGGDDEPGEIRLDRNQRTGLFNRWIQHDAAINPGNSGGPLVNLKGQVVGVNTRGSFFGGDMGFAIPSNVAREVADLLIQHGEVPRSRLGLSLKPIKKTGLKQGVLVNSVEKDGPADQAGIQAGDVILRIGGEPITVSFPEEVPPVLKRLADLPIGQPVEITYQRGGETFDTKLVTEKLKKDQGDEAAFRAWGITAMDITEKMARDRRLDSTAGVLVTSVRDGGPAQLAEPAIGEDDVLLSINSEAITNLDGLIHRYDTIMDSDPLPEWLLVEFDRRGKNNVTLVKPKRDKDENPPPEVRKAWLGIATQPVLKKLAENLGHPGQRGFRITRVYPKTLAAQTDLRAGDVILALNGDKVSPRGMQDTGLLARRIRKLDIDGEATLTVLRGGETHDVAVRLEPTRITPAEALRDRNDDFELSVREVTFFDRDENRWDENVQGVLVERVESGGWAGLGNIESGDLLQRIDDHPITDLKTYRDAMEKVTQAQPQRVVFVVLRGVRTHFQYVEPDWKPVASDESEGDANEQTTDTE